MTRKELYRRVIEYFTVATPNAETELKYADAYSLLVAVILSAQCTDKRVNQITPQLLAAFPDARALSEATPEEVFPYIKSCSYPNSKSRNLIGMARVLTSDFNGIVPSDPSELVRLPGVGRKTANVIASVVYSKPVMAVDTHVFRVAARLGLTRNAKTPLEAEKQLTAGFPASLLHKAHHWLILHGRYICKARKPACSECGLTDLCLWYRRNAERTVSET
ncbi:MAG: endonuclease III [Bacteroidales bacterium]